MESMIYECVTYGPQGKEYMLRHKWHEQHTFFGIICNYRCVNCGKKVSKKDFINLNYHLYEKTDRY